MNFSDLVTLLAVPLVIVYVVVPLLFYFVAEHMQSLFFLSFVKLPYTDYSDLGSHGVKSIGRNFYLKTDTGTSMTNVNRDNTPKLGVWHILPASVSAKFQGKDLTDAEMEKLMDQGDEAILIYLHGNSFDRTTMHRCKLYNVLSELDFHVVVFDYRGYGDSTGTPTEDGLNDDCHTIHDYVKRVAPSKPIVLWGHSMGSGVVTRLTAELCDAGRGPEALILESPFNNLRDVVRGHPFSIPLRRMPFFDEIIVHPLMRAGLRMCSEDRIGRIICPILVMHAADDPIIPVGLARKLVDAAMKAKCKIEYIEFAHDRDFKHKFIHRANELPVHLRKLLPNTHLAKRNHVKSS